MIVFEFLKQKREQKKTEYSNSEVQQMNERSVNMFRDQ